MLYGPKTSLSLTMDFTCWQPTWHKATIVRANDEFHCQQQILIWCLCFSWREKDRVLLHIASHVNCKQNLIFTFFKCVCACVVDVFIYCLSAMNRLQGRNEIERFENRHSAFASIHVSQKLSSKNSFRQIRSRQGEQQHIQMHRTSKRGLQLVTPGRFNHVLFTFKITWQILNNGESSSFSLMRENIVKKVNGMSYFDSCFES